MAEKDDIITFSGDNGDTVEFRVIEETKLNGVKYLLGQDMAAEDGDEVVILKETSEDGAEEVSYEFLENEDEIDAIAGIFEGLLDDVSFV